jgi:tRNA G18 (ribose-2'-O)-methylase SpoU
VPESIDWIESLESPELQPYRTLKRPVDHVRKGIFVAEGELVVRRLLDSPLEVVSLLLTPVWLERMLHAGRDIRTGVRIFMAHPELLREIVGYNIHQGVLAVGRVPSEPLVTGLPSPHLLVALDGLRMSDNVGVVVRNCAAFGVDAVLVGERSCSPWMRRAVRNSMGTVFRMCILHMDSLAHALSDLRSRFGTRIVVSDPEAGVDIHHADLAHNLCIVFGSEDSGVSEDTRDLACLTVAIPMRRGIDSLNVGSASAVFLYEAARWRAGLTTGPA